MILNWEHCEELSSEIKEDATQKHDPGSNSKEHNLSQEGKSCSAGQEISRLL